jgi:hypothetical protein
MHTLKTGASRLIERILPKSDAQAGCIEETYYDCDRWGSHCRQCWINSNCRHYCGPYT